MKRWLWYLFTIAILITGGILTMMAANAASNVYYVDGSSGGNGTAAAPFSTLNEAIAAGTGDVTVVLCGNVRLTAATSLKNPAITHATFTSLYGGKDYRPSGAALGLEGNLFTYFPITMDNMKISAGSVKFIVCNGYDATFGSGLSCEGDPYIIGGLSGSSTNRTSAMTYTLTVNGGQWGQVRCGSCARNRGTYADRVTTVINGGEFHNKAVIAGTAQHTSTKANFSMTVNGGQLFGGIYATANAADNASYTFKGTVSLTINGGTIGGSVTPATTYDTALTGGSFTVRINGGDYGSLAEMEGTAERYTNCRMTSELTIGDGVNAYAVIEGTRTFRNAQKAAADPWITYWKGAYYFTATGSAKINVYKAANISDLRYASAKTAYEAPADENFTGLWSPELHYFSAEDFGEENEGWYMFLAGNRENPNGGGAYPVMFVMKSLSGEPDGPYGDLSGNRNRYTTVGSSVGVDYIANWAVGQTVIRIGGKIYAMYVGEVGRGTSGFKQYIYIAEMLNPYTLGAPTAIVEPEYSWEKSGYTHNADYSKWWPMVVEGGTAIYGDNGEIYVAYSGSGYWTTDYCLAQLTFRGGDPLKKSNWVKESTPFLVRTSTLNASSLNGTGHASYTTDFDGNRWVCYHAYIGTDTSSGRYAIFEPYGITSSGKLYVGEGTGHPASLSKTYTLTVNPTPLRDRIRGFDTADYHIALHGDTDGDGILTNSDATRLAQHLAGWDTDIGHTEVADMNGDNVIANDDYAALIAALDN